MTMIWLFIRPPSYTRGALTANESKVGNTYLAIIVSLLLINMQLFNYSGEVINGACMHAAMDISYSCAVWYGVCKCLEIVVLANCCS